MRPAAGEGRLDVRSDDAPVDVPEHVLHVVVVGEQQPAPSRLVLRVTLAAEHDGGEMEGGDRDFGG